MCVRSVWGELDSSIVGRIKPGAAEYVSHAGGQLARTLRSSHRRLWLLGLGVLESGE